MQIQSVKLNQSTIYFSSTNRSVKKLNGDLDYSNYTFFFRDDIKWGPFCEELKEKYKDQKKVNVYSLASSDGSEAYSLIMALEARLGKREAEKFFPIIAVDKDEYVIRRASEGFMQIYPEDIDGIKRTTGKDFREFMTVTGRTREAFNVKIKPELRDKVIFKTNNILDEMDKIKPNNSVVMFRNAWQYLNPEEKTILSDKITNKLGNNSIYILGHADKRESDAMQRLEENGLLPVETSSYIGYQKSETSENKKISPELLFNLYAKQY